MKILKSINDYLNNEAITGKDVIIISLISSFAFWILKDSFLKIKDLFIKLLKYIKKKRKKLWRVYVKGNLNFNEFKKVKEKKNQEKY